MTSRQTLQPAAESRPAADKTPFDLDRSVVLVGLMGAGKTRVGRRLAERLNLPFIDTDHEIEAETGKAIAELFATIGEPAFREGERRLIARLLKGPVTVIASGGGAYIDPATRAAIGERAIAVWLKADLETLIARTSRSNRRPLLEGVDRRVRLTELMAARYPIYEQADLVVESVAGPVEETVDSVIVALQNFIRGSVP